MEKQKELLNKKDLLQLTSLRQTLLAQVYSTGIVKVKSNTNWEELTCVGYLPEKSQLEAVIQVKRSTGYSGGLCAPDSGSFEYVRFFIDWGSGFENAGLTSFKVHDISDAPAGEQHPIEYLSYLELDEANHKRICNFHVLPKVKAVLSWNVPPSEDPNDYPAFGNAVECYIQIKPRRMFIKDIINITTEKNKLASNLLNNYDLEAPIPIAPFKQLKYTKSYIEDCKKKKIPDHRTFYPLVQPLLQPSALNISSAELDKSILSDLKIDISSIIGAIESDTANVSFEELGCVGFSTSTDKLGAIIHIKKKNGYGGSLCDKGSFENVAFWADWNNNGTWDEHLGTVSVKVHDLGDVPDEGLCYAVELPIDVSKRLQSCLQPNIIKIRGVLSWSKMPSTTDPDDLNTWGNRVDALVQIRPGQATVGNTPTDRFDFIGNVTVDQISPLTHLAYPCPIFSPSTNRPWGGSVNFRAEILNSGAPGNVHFQVQYEMGAGNWVPVNTQHTFRMSEPAPGGGTLFTNVFINAADYGGWFPYLADQSVGRAILSDLLANWETGVRAGAYKVRLAYTTDITNHVANIQCSKEYEIMLDNVKFNVNPGFGAAVDPSYSVDLVIDGGDCHQYEKGNSFTGHLRVIDKYFGSWNLHLEPTAHYTGAPITPSSRVVNSLSDNGDGSASWTLETEKAKPKPEDSIKLDPCGYTVRLRGVKRTIFNSSVGHFHHADKYVGFSVI